ncbi:hypothetical protein D3C76_1540340 [compost metagenome]
MYRLSQRHCRNQIHIKCVQPILARGGNALVAVSAGQVDQEVDPAETRTHLFDRMRNEFVICHIEVKKNRSLAELGRRLETRFTIDIEQRNASPSVNKRPSHGGADQGRAATDHGDLVL